MAITVYRTDRTGGIATLLALASCVLAAAPTPRQAYTNPTHEWSVRPPGAWTVADQDPSFVRFVSPMADAQCGIHSAQVSLETVDEWTDLLLARTARNLQDGKGLKSKVLSRRSISLPRGIVGNDVVVDLLPGGRSRQVFVLTNGRAYALDCETASRSWKEYESQFESVITSFTIVSNDATHPPSQATVSAPSSNLPAPNPDAGGDTPRERPAWQQRMAHARSLAAKGQEYVAVINSTDGPAGSSGVFVFYNNPSPFCYTYMIPGSWERADNGYRSKEGEGLVDVVFVLPQQLEGIKGATLVERARNFETRGYETALGQALADVDLIPFESSRQGAWLWRAAPVSRNGQTVVLPSKVIVDLGPDAVVVISVMGTPDDHGLARRVIEGLRTTSNEDCYYSVLEKLWRTSND